MAPQTDATTEPRDDRVEAVEEVTISWETFKKALQRNYLDDDYYGQRQGRSFVLRLYPPFEAEMVAEYYVSVQGRHYDSNWNQKPIHVSPEWIMMNAKSTHFRRADFPTEVTEQNHLTDEEIDEAGGIEAVVKEGREWYWDELKYDRPDELELEGSSAAGYYSKTVSINWVE